MTNDRKRKLEKLLKENKVKQAKIQLVEDLKKYHDIDITDKEYIDYQISEEVHKKVYERIRTDEIKFLKFPYEQEILKSKINFIFDYFKKYENNTVLFYPSTFGFYYRSSNQLYLNFPIAITIPLLNCKKIIMKLMLEMHDDLIVVSEELGFGFILSEDEYSDVTIEYWEK